MPIVLIISDKLTFRSKVKATALASDSVLSINGWYKTEPAFYLLPDNKPH